ncbi:MAG: CotH kinase family protein [Planctomycetes bacterium]|nr:CotH kinase family protein [Planctomycetota bacterium]
MRLKISTLLAFSILSSLPILAADADVIINEIHYHPASDDDGEEYIELYNRGSEAVSLEGWSFTNGVAFTFPAGAAIQAGGYLVVAKNADNLQKLHQIAGAIGNYEGVLSNSGERLTLRNAAGITIESFIWRDGPPFPTLPDGDGPSLERRQPTGDNDQPANWRASRGSWRFFSAAGEVKSGILFFRRTGPGALLVDDVTVTLQGSSADLLNGAGNFEAGAEGWAGKSSHRNSAWEPGAGHGGSASFKVASTGAGSSSSQVEFTLANPPPVGSQATISFWARWLEGTTPVAFGMKTGSPFAVVELTGTPGSENTVRAGRLPPSILSVSHSPKRSAPSDIVAISAVVTENGARVSAVTLEVHENDQVSSIDMRDDGLSGDGAPGDGVWAAQLAPRPHRSLVRYRVIARDIDGQTEEFPIPGEPTEAMAYFVENPRDPAPAIAAFQFEIAKQQLAALTARADIYQPGTLIFEGEVYDLGLDLNGHPNQPAAAASNVGLHGFRHRGSNTAGNAKKPWKVKFHKDHLFDRGIPEVFGEPRRKINLNAWWTNKDFERELLAYEAFEEIGCPSSYVEHARVELNDEYHGLFIHLEQVDEAFLRRNQLDEQGDIWKSSSGTAVSAGGYEKKTNLRAGNQQLNEFIARMGRARSETEREKFIAEAFDAERFRDYLVTTAVISNADHPHKNHYMFRDSTSSRWTQFPWDMDLTFGQNHECESSCSGGKFPPGGSDRDCIRWKNHILLGTARHPKCDGPWNKMIDTFLVSEPTNAMFRDRIEETLETYLTPAHLHPRMDALRELVKDEVPLDRGKWGSWGNPVTWNYQDRVEELKGWVTLRSDFLLASLPKPAAELTCQLRSGSVVELHWKNQGTYRLLQVRLNGEYLKTVNGTAEEAAIELPPGLSGEQQIELVALSKDDVYAERIRCSVTIAPPRFIRGDVNGDGALAESDAISELRALFLGDAAPGCLAAADVNADGRMELTDAILLLEHLLIGGPPPAAPFPECGEAAGPGLECLKPTCN